jgi:type 1 glutamine amidotransferase
MNRLLALGLVLGVASSGIAADMPQLKALIIDGQSDHDWKATTPILKKILEDTKLFTVDVATAPEPPRKPRVLSGDATAEEREKYEIAFNEYLVDRKAYDARLNRFRPQFSEYNVVVSNYNGDRWSTPIETAFAQYVEKGGGFVSVHAADNAFGAWPEYNLIIGLGGWGGRDMTAGPYVRYRDGKIVREQPKGPTGSYGTEHVFVVDIRDSKHPVTSGLPERWKHASDEIFAQLRGPAKNLTVLATALSEPKTGGTGQNEPVLMAIEYGKGRCFHTTLGHGPIAMKCVGFQTTLARGAEWAATGKVTQKVPPDFPTADKISVRP